jgi:hypothetical protein
VRHCAAPALVLPIPYDTDMVVEHHVVLELPFEIGLAPKPDPIQILALDGSDQSLDESMRTRRCGNGVRGELQFIRHLGFEIDCCSVAASDTTEGLRLEEEVRRRISHTAELAQLNVIGNARF